MFIVADVASLKHKDCVYLLDMMMIKHNYYAVIAIKHVLLNQITCYKIYKHFLMDI